MFVIRLFYAFMQMPMPKYQQNLVLLVAADASFEAIALVCCRALMTPHESVTAVPRRDVQRIEADRNRDIRRF